MRHLFVDTSAWYALVNRKDKSHAKLLELIQGHADKLITSNFVFDETITLVLYRQGHQAARQIGDVLRDAAVVDLLRPTAGDEEAAWELFLNRADKTYSFTDCTSFVLMRRLNIKQAASFDADFEREGFDLA